MTSKARSEKAVQLQWFFWDIHSGERQLSCKNSETTTQKRLHVDLPVGNPSLSQHLSHFSQGARHVKEGASWWFQPPTFKSPQTFESLRQRQTSLLCLVLIPNPHNPWAWKSDCFTSLSFRVAYHTAIVTGTPRKKHGVHEVPYFFLIPHSQ